MMRRWILLLLSMMTWSDGAIGVNKYRFRIRFDKFYGNEKLQIIVPMKNNSLTVQALMVQINAKVGHKYQIKVSELQIDGYSLFEHDKLIDLINPDISIVDIEAIWRKTKNVSPLEVKNTCEGFHGCPKCTSIKGCWWCSSTNKCISKKLKNLCPLHNIAFSKKCLDFNLKKQRQIFLRPCHRWARHDEPFYGGTCCGDAKCNKKLEDFNSCPKDCLKNNSKFAISSTSYPNTLPPKITHKVASNVSSNTIFGDNLKELIRDTYHCEETYEFDSGSPCSGKDDRVRNRPSNWLSAILSKARANQIPFKFPLEPKIVVELGSGLGQDTRNLVIVAGFNKIIGVEVSSKAVQLAKLFTPKKKYGNHITYLAYDALALPKPKAGYKIDLLLDFTVYCGLRHRYLSRLYSLWERLMHVNHTILMLQCWKSTTNSPVPILLKDILLDVEPILQVLHYESCEKNQMLGGKDGAWCIYLKRTDDVKRKEEAVQNRLALYKFHDTFDYSFNVLKRFIIEGKTKFEQHSIWSNIFRLAMVHCRNSGKSKQFKKSYNVVKKLIHLDIVNNVNDDSIDEANLTFNDVKSNLIKIALHALLELKKTSDDETIIYFKKSGKKMLIALLENSLMLLEENNEFTTEEERNYL
jgi:hypothetical protein